MQWKHFNKNKNIDNYVVYKVTFLLDNCVVL